MNKKKMIIIIGLFLLLLTSFRLLWLNHYMTSDYPYAEGGILDLRGVELPDDKAITLNGEWAFFGNQLIAPESLTKQFSGAKQQWIRVPGDWVETVSDDRNIPYGYGTYRLQILLDGQSKLYTMSFKEIKSSATVFINGERVAEMGRVAETVESAIQDYRPFEVSIDGNLKEIDLIIQVSNYNVGHSGGIVKSIKFGNSASMKKDQMMSSLMQFMSATILFLHGIYVLVIFLVFVRKRELVFLSIVFFCATVSVLADDDKVLLYLFPSISSGMWAKILYLSYASSAFFLLQFCRPIMTRHSNSKARVFNLYRVLNLVYLLFIVSVLIDFKIVINPFFSVIMLLIPMIIPLVILKKVAVSEAGIIYLLLATISIASSAIWGDIKNKLSVSLPYYPIDIILGVIFFAVFWFKRFFLATEETKNLAGRLQKEIERKDEFLANTSHELRNPLHGIINMSQAIYDNEKDDLTEESKQNLRILMTVGRRMSMILNDLLDITKLKENGIRLQVKETDLASVVSSVFDTLGFMKEGKSIVFVQTIPETFPKIEADENRLFQILFNLVHNAVKYMNEGEVVVSAESQKEMAIIHVQDNGIGMDEETMKSIFLPYEQADSDMTAIAGGIGLGLSICEQLVKLHGGLLSVKSSVGKGSTFTFTLPISANQTSDPLVRLTVVDVTNGNKRTEQIMTIGFPRILVVDDDPLNLAIVERILVAEQLEIITCTSGKEALVLLDKGKWDLVISDVMMPSMSGYQLAQKIRERFTISELPILLLTARSQLEDIQTGFQCGASDYVTKPVEKIELVSRVKALIDLKTSIGERVRMEAAWLQAQIQPHFLFNTLNTIAALSEVNPPKMVELLDKFGDYLHASFASHNLNPVIQLENELELVRSYLFIEQERFGERLNVEWEVEKIPAIGIPPLSIQTIVENAIQHGVLKRPEGGTVRIQVIEQPELVEITILDDGVGIPEGKLKNLLTHQIEGHRGIGLLNTDKRLKQQYGSGIDITSVPDVGTTVRFIVPKEE
ncbi:ATP-binding protein [Sporosarcina sp. FSL K6-1540]|uniref:hybrid sensor histidine kinase/response regulator n=1 Tax=Sporosarcina sp. FSL K6-1540 TaxID=2921555 RepID=UPI00315A1B6F